MEIIKASMLCNALKKYKLLGIILILATSKEVIIFGISAGIIYFGIGHYVQTLEPYWALPFWIITRYRENMLLPIWIIMRAHDLIYILICILMKWLPIDFPTVI